MGYAIRDDGQGWRAVSSEADLLDGESYSQGVPSPIPADKSIEIRGKRDRLLVEIYDRGTMMCQRGLRMTADPLVIASLNAKQAELDLFAVAMQSIPDQPGFPDDVEWPEIPRP